MKTTVVESSLDTGLLVMIKNNQSQVSQSVSVSVNQSASQLVSQTRSQSVSLSVSQSVRERHQDKLLCIF